MDIKIDSDRGIAFTPENFIRGDMFVMAGKVWAVIKDWEDYTSVRVLRLEDSVIETFHMDSNKQYIRVKTLTVTI